MFWSRALLYFCISMATSANADVANRLLRKATENGTNVTIQDFIPRHPAEDNNGTTLFPWRYLPQSWNQTLEPVETSFLLLQKYNVTPPNGLDVKVNLTGVHNAWILPKIQDSTLILTVFACANETNWEKCFDPQVRNLKAVVDQVESDYKWIQQNLTGRRLRNIETMRNNIEYGSFQIAKVFIQGEVFWYWHDRTFPQIEVQQDEHYIRGVCQKQFLDLIVDLDYQIDALVAERDHALLDGDFDLADELGMEEQNRTDEQRAFQGKLQICQAELRGQMKEYRALIDGVERQGWIWNDEDCSWVESTLGLWPRGPTLRNTNPEITAAVEEKIATICFERSEYLQMFTYE